MRLILISALQVDKAVFFSVLIIVAAFVPLFTMQGVQERSGAIEVHKPASITPS